MYAAPYAVQFDPDPGQGRLAVYEKAVPCFVKPALAADMECGFVRFGGRFQVFRIHRRERRCRACLDFNRRLVFFLHIFRRRHNRRVLTGFVINGLVVAGLFPAVRLLLFSLRSLRFGCCLGLFLQRVDDYRNSCCSARFRFHFAVCCAQVPLRRNCLRQRNDPDPSGFRKRHGRLAGVDGTGFPAILQHAELTGQPDGHLRSVRRGPHAAKVDSERGDSRGRHGDHPADQHHDKQTGNKPFSQIHFQKGLPEA